MTIDALATARTALKQARAWEPHSLHDRKLRDENIANLEAYIRARGDHTAGGGDAS